MTFSCPYRHVPYSTWRIDVFRSLFQSSAPYRSSASLPSREHTSQALGRRKYGSSSYATKNKTPASAKDATTPESLIAARSDKKDVAPTEFNPYSPEGREALENLITELRAASKGLWIQGSKTRYWQLDGTNHVSLNLGKSKGSGAVNTSTAKEPPRSNDVEKVRKKSSQKIEKAGDRTIPKARPFAGSLSIALEGSVAISESPVLSWPQAMRRQRREAKIHPSYHNIKGLKNNPWAESLAGSLRACMGSGARLPVDHLLDLSLVKSPQDGNIYLVPADLADIDALERKMAAALAGSQESSEEDVEFESEGTDAKPASKFKPPRVPVRSFPLSRLIFNITFLQFLSDTLIKRSKTSPYDPDQTPTHTSIPDEVSKLIHYGRRKSITGAQRYLANKRRSDAAFPVSPEATPPPPAPVDQQNVEHLSLSKLQWQADMPLRVAHIMRRRILVALKAFADAEDAAKTQDVPRRVSVVTAIAFPRDGLKGDELGTLHPAAEDSGESATPIQLVQTEQEQNDNHTLDDAPSPTDVDVTPDPGNASSTDSPSPSEHEQSLYQPLGHQEWLAGSAFLHIGNNSLAAIPYSSASAPDSKFPPLRKQNPLIPPMLPVSNYRFPIFSLHRLFSHPAAATTSSELDELRALLAHPSFQLRRPDTQGASDYLLFVRPFPGPGATVVDEIWRLWRYLGGENMNVSFSEPSPEERRKVERPTTFGIEKVLKLSDSGRTLGKLFPERLNETKA